MTYGHDARQRNTPLPARGSFFGRMLLACALGLAALYLLGCTSTSSTLYFARRECWGWAHALPAKQRPAVGSEQWRSIVRGCVKERLYLGI